MGPLCVSPRPIIIPELIGDYLFIIGCITAGFRIRTSRSGRFHGLFQADAAANGWCFDGPIFHVSIVTP